METLTTDGPPWHCDDFAPAGSSPPLAGPAKPVPAPKAAAPREARGFLTIADSLAISLTLFAAIGLLAGGQGASPSHSRDLAPIMVIVPMR